VNSFDPWCVLQSSPPGAQMVVPAPYYGSLAPGGPWGCSGGGFVVPFPMWCPESLVGVDPPRAERSALTASVAPVLDPIVSRLTAEARLDDQHLLHVAITADGERREGTLDLGPAVASIVANLARWHALQHAAPGNSGEIAVASVDRAVGAAGQALVEALCTRQVCIACAGWLDDLGGALKETLQKFKGPIVEAATAAASQYGGSKAGAIASQLVGPVIDAVTQGKETPEKAAAEQQAAVDPTVAQGLATAKTAAAHAIVAFHVGETASRAAAGHPDAQQQIATFARDVERGDPVARAVAPVVTQAFASVRHPETYRPAAIAAITRAAEKLRAQGAVVAAYGYARRGSHQRTTPFRSADEARNWYTRSARGRHEYVALFDATNLAQPLLDEVNPAHALLERGPTTVAGFFDTLKSAFRTVTLPATWLNKKVAQVLQTPGIKQAVTAVATGVATIYGGPAAGALAAKLTGPIIDSTAETGGDPTRLFEKTKQKALEKHAVDPKSAQAVEHAHRAVMQTAVAYTLQTLAAEASRGDPQAIRQIGALQQAARDGDATAARAVQVLAHFQQGAAASLPRA